MPQKAVHAERDKSANHFGRKLRENRMLERTVGRLALGHVEFAETEIAKRNVTDIVDQDVFGLQVTADEHARMR